jgi:hypothetical protein
VPVDEALQDLSRRSSSAWAKNALASFRISLAGAFLDLALQFLDAFALFSRGDAITLAGIDLRAA